MSFFNYSTFSQLCRNDTTEELRQRYQIISENLKLISDCFALFYELVPYMARPSFYLQSQLKTPDDIEKLTAQVKLLQPKQTKDCWTPFEHSRFVIGLLKYGQRTPEIYKVVQTRTTKQVASHMQKYLQKVAKAIYRPATIRPCNIPQEFLVQFISYLQEKRVEVKDGETILQKTGKNMRVGNFGKECYGLESVIVLPCDIKFDLLEAKSAVIDLVCESREGAVVFKRLLSLGDNYDYLLQKAAEVSGKYVRDIMICVTAEFFGLADLGI